MNCQCGAELSGMWLEEPGVASAFCACGHRNYFFKRADTGEWETAEERRKRMAVTLVCRGCRKTFEEAAPAFTERNERVYCNDCREKNMANCKARLYRRRALEFDGAELSKNSPWRTFGKTLGR